MVNKISFQTLHSVLAYKKRQRSGIKSKFIWSQFTVSGLHCAGYTVSMVYDQEEVSCDTKIIENKKVVAG
jgi:hypothetical protein